MNLDKIIFPLLLLFSPILLFGQSDIWTNVILSPDAHRASVYGPCVGLHLDENQFERILATATIEFSNQRNKLVLEFPAADGTLESFEVYHSTIMEAGLAAKFPNIKTYLIKGIDDAGKQGRLSVTSNGLKAQIWSTEDTYYVERMNKNKSGAYFLYKRSAMSDVYDRVCLVEHDDMDFEASVNVRSERRTMGDKLRTYRLAVATTGEYSEYHGGTITSALEAIVESVNRLNVIYERECAIRFLLVDRNDELINLDPDTDPFNEGNAGQMLRQNPQFINSRISSNAYDVGHVFATGGAGLASLRSVCSPDKAEGVTGIFPPEGTAYVVEYLAHEIGHQFGAAHSFNRCPGQEVPNFAYEPGSGSTIMSYAGLCGTNNVIPGSNDYFHVVSLAQIDAFTEGNGGSCAEDIETGNTIPEVQVPEGGFFIPISTPFELVGSGTDADEDELTYCWEQFDLGPSSALGSPTGNAPLFRSFEPTENPNRVFPRMNLVLDNLTNRTEVLPTNTRDLTFMLTVRDNKLGSGGTAWDQVAFNSTSAAGPFIVTSQNSTDEEWTETEEAEITWDVANTDVAPVNCETVDIYLSKNLGLTFDILLAENVPNTGSATIVVPEDTRTNFARIKIAASDNIFFNVNRTRFRILSAPPVATTYVEDSKDLVVFPNPASEYVSIDLEKFTDLADTNLSLFTTTGTLVHYSEQLDVRHNIDLEDFSAGVYILQVKTIGAVHTKKLIIH